MLIQFVYKVAVLTFCSMVLVSCFDSERESHRFFPGVVSLIDERNSVIGDDVKVIGYLEFSDRQNLILPDSAYRALPYDVKLSASIYVKDTDAKNYSECGGRMAVVYGRIEVFSGLLAFEEIDLIACESVANQ